MKSAAAVFSLPTDLGTALTWAAQAFTACGYTKGPSSTVQQGTVTVRWDQQYGSPTIPSLDLDLSFTVNPAGGTLIEYQAAALSFPPRPYASQIPGGIKKVKMTFDPGAYGEPRPGKSLHLTITNTALALELAGAVNGPKNPPLVHSCGGIRGAVRMVFVTAHTTMTVTDGCAEVTVDHFPPLADDYRVVWIAARLVVAQYCATHHCRRG